MYGKFTFHCLRVVFAFLCLCVWPAVNASAQSDSFPPPNVTAAQDWAQMLSQLRITLPTLPLKKADPNRDPASISRQADGEGDYSDSYGFQLTRSSWGLWTQYSGDPYTFGYTADSLQLGLKYTQVNVLKSEDGTLINSAPLWENKRRPEIVDMSMNELYGRMPDQSILPAVTWSVGARTQGGTGAGAYYQYAIAGYIDSSRYPEVRNKPRISATLRIPQSATGPVPVMIAISTGSISATHWNASYPNGWGVCSFNCSLLQSDNGAGLTSYLIGLVNKGNWRKPDDWGVLRAWSWGVSRLVDLFETYTDVQGLVVDSKKIGVTGHSRWGKAALVTMAFEPRIAIGFPSCSGALGVVQSQRHWGEELELVAGSGEYHWCAGNIMKYGGELTPGVYKPRKVENLKVDGQSVLALCAPRPVFLNGGKPGDSWQDPYGAYLSAQLASPVWNLYGFNGVVMNDKDTIGRDFPIFDKNYTDGRIAYRVHSVGGHADTPDDWAAFMQFARKNLQDVTLPVLFNAFTAERKNAMVTLKWATATEQQNTGFRVQRNQDGTWQNIGFVPSRAVNGNASPALSYSFTDVHPSGRLLQYRILQVSSSGMEKYSDVRIVPGEGQAQGIVVFPNPAVNGKVNVFFDGLSARDILVSDMNGSVVKKYNNVINNVEISGLRSGVYSIRVTDRVNGGKTVKTVIVQ